MGEAPNFGGSASRAHAQSSIGIASKNGDSKDNCSAADANRCNPEGVQQRDDAKSFANVATVLTVLGGASVATGVVLFVAAPDTEDPVGQAAVFGVRGTF